MSITFFSLCFYLGLAGYTASLVFFLIRKERIGKLFFSFGFISHTMSLISRAWLIGIFTPNAMFNEVFFLPWCLALLGVVLKISEDKFVYILLPVLFFSLLALFFPKGIFPPSPKQNTILSSLFFLFEVLAHACFILGAWLALFYLRNRIFYKEFDTLIVFGFVFYTIAQVVGAYWCYLGWATPFHWGDRHLQSASLWCYYAAYLHLKFLPNGNIKNKAIFALLGLGLVLLFSYGGQLKEMHLPRLGA